GRLVNRGHFTVRKGGGVEARRLDRVFVEPETNRVLWLHIRLLPCARSERSPRSRGKRVGPMAASSPRGRRHPASPRASRVYASFGQRTANRDVRYSASPPSHPFFSPDEFTICVFDERRGLEPDSSPSSPSPSLEL